MAGQKIVNEPPHNKSPHNKTNKIIFALVPSDSEDIEHKTKQISWDNKNTNDHFEKILKISDIW